MELNQPTVETHILENRHLNRYLFQVSEYGVGITRSEYFKNHRTGFSCYSNRFIGHFTKEEARQQWKRIMSASGWYHKK